MKSARRLILILLLALVFRLALVSVVNFPGIADPNHYYNMGVRLLNGHGFTIDYIWQYNLPPAALEHPEEHWMPLAAVLAAGGMAALGETARAAILPFALLGALLPALTYWAARQVRLSDGAALFSALAAALLPEFVLNSVRTDTTIPAALFVSASALLLNEGLRRGGMGWYAASGAAAGLGYLTRSDAVLILPMLAVTLIVHAWVRRRGGGEFHLRWAWLLPLTALLVALPWFARNLSEIGMIGSPETADMFFFTDHNDHYAYGRTFTLQTMLERQTIGQIIGKRLFEMAAGLKQMVVGLDALALFVIGGLALLIAARDRDRLLALAPALILLLGAYVAYTVFIPYKAQAGSFKKAYLMTLPLLLPLAGWALDRAVTEARIRASAMVLLLILLGANAFELVRADARTSDTYLATIQRMAEHAQTLPDTNGDGEIILMTQDPYILRYVGLRSVMFPFEDRVTTHSIALRYGVDYLLMPAARPSLDPLYARAETDPRFTFAAGVPTTTYEFWRVEAAS